MSDQIRWAQVNGEPFEYAIQQGPHGDEFVKLLDGSSLRRALPQRAGREDVIEECASALAQWYPDNANTNAFCAAIRSLKALPAVQERWVSDGSIAALKRALEPFAKSVDNYADCTDEARFIDNDATITVADVREARVVLSSSPAPASEGWREIIEQCAKVAENYQRDASFDDSIVGAGEHNANQINIANAIRRLALPAPPSSIVEGQKG